MNSSDIEFSVHDGDFKAGNATAGSTTPTTCSDALYTQTLGYLNALSAPAMVTPGDNDWTDCDRPSNGGFDSLERLDHERQVIFPTPFSLGQHTMRQAVQTTPSCLGVSGSVQCVENRRWTVKNVTYATVNIQGSCNNLCDTDPDPNEYAARNAADIAWIQQTFAEAKANGAAAVMIIGQADPGFDLSDATRAPLRDPKTLVEADTNPDGFHDFLVAFRNEIDRLRQAGRLRARRLPLLPRRQAVPRQPGPAARELHARRDLRRQPGERQQRRPLGEGARRSAAAATSSPSSRRSCRQTGSRFRLRSASPPSGAGLATAPAGGLKRARRVRPPRRQTTGRST